jgi:hypothetical protein
MSKIKIHLPPRHGNTFIVGCPACKGRVIINLKMHHVPAGKGKQQRLL